MKFRDASVAARRPPKGHCNKPSKRLLWLGLEWEQKRRIYFESYTKRIC